MLQETRKALENADESLDDPLLVGLREGTVKLLSCKWLISDASNAVLRTDPGDRLVGPNGICRMRYRQELEALCPDAFLTPDEAVQLFETARSCAEAVGEAVLGLEAVVESTVLYTACVEEKSASNSS